MNYREIRKKNGYTQSGIAHMFNINQATVSRFESGSKNEYLREFYQQLGNPMYIPIAATTILVLGTIFLTYLIFS